MSGSRLVADSAARMTAAGGAVMVLTHLAGGRVVRAVVAGLDLDAGRARAELG
ncbi:hypothetical protein GCM10022223_60510 [Kineosporia mesophila]|uniref:Uncharacterized protein n=1 Tax=Kineosporia mesophila TaxID=566012 RepID=A0ABP7AK16_9ACTN|nr:hypothetical protein [Kineosporia mesophila]MCD5352502.1 hypothetical protein [Kineosporia mesophila]